MEFEEILKMYQDQMVEIQNMNNQRAIFEAAMQLKAGTSLDSSACVAEALQVWFETKRAVSELEGRI